MTIARRLRVYADTSVFGGCFDDEFTEDSKAFHGVNLIRGYKPVCISSPKEVIEP